MTVTTDLGTVDPSVIPKAIRVLQVNWSGSYTVPAGGLYPHQWSWDSAFIAIGLRHASPKRAGQEIDSLLAGQWADGRIPQIIFDPHRDEDYSPGASFWRSELLDASPDDVLTAGLVQPPNHAWAVWKVHQADPVESRRRRFLERAYPRLVAWHEYLLTRRNRGGNGLACIVHPWESGTDNSPLWDEVLRKVPAQSRHTIVRPDLLHADATERPTHRDYGRYFWLAERYRDHDCDDTDDDYPFLMEDPGFNTLLAISELALARIATEVGADGARHTERAGHITTALDDLFDHTLGCYVAGNIRDSNRVAKATINGLLPLLIPGIGHAQELLETTRGPRFLGSNSLLIPSYDATAADLEPQLYWRGPAWFNMNWMMITALANSGERELSNQLAATAARLALDNGFPEYVNPWTGSPHGTRQFSWTAALCLDLAIQPKHALL